jgi:hypothetical protein
MSATDRSDRNPYANEDTPPLGMAALPEQPEPESHTRRTVFIGVIVLLIGVSLTLWITGPQTEYNLVFRAIAILFAMAVPFVTLRWLRGPRHKIEEKVLEQTENHPISKRVSQRSLPNEKIYAERRRHPISMLGWWAITLVGNVGFVWLFLLTGHQALDGTVWQAIFRWTLAVLWVIGMNVALLKSIEWWVDRFCITNLRLFMVTGFIKLTVPHIPYPEIADFKMVIPWHSNVLTFLGVIKLPYCTYIAESAGEDQAMREVYWIPAGGLLYTHVIGPRLPAKG